MGDLLVGLSGAPVLDGASLAAFAARLRKLGGGAPLLTFWRPAPAVPLAAPRAAPAASPGAGVDPEVVAANLAVDVANLRAMGFPAVPTLTTSRGTRRRRRRASPRAPPF